MIQVHVEVGSIARIEALAAKAFAGGEPESANPYRPGSTSARIWRLFFDSCKLQADRHATQGAVGLEAKS